MADAGNKTSIKGDDDPNGVGFAVLGIGRDISRPPAPPTDVRGVGVLGLTGNAADTHSLEQFLQLAGSPFSSPQAVPADNILKLLGPLPQAGVCGISTSSEGAFVGVLGYKNTGEPNGTLGFLAGTSPGLNNATGAYGESQVTGVVGRGNGIAGFGVVGVGGSQGFGVAGNTNSGSGTGVHGHTSTSVGVLGTSDGSGVGVSGRSSVNDGVQGRSDDSHHSGVAGFNDVGGAGIFGRGSPAGRFIGDVEVSGDVRLLNGQDCAENFDIVNIGEAEPGTVMVLCDNEALELSLTPYDKRVVGVVSGAGDCRPGIILGKQSPTKSRMPIALLGKVYCKVDAQYAPVEVGDLLTTSSTPGHAMKADDPIKAFGAVIGKALHPLATGQGLIAILVALQ